MSGTIGRQGYEFQDHLLLLRVLDVLITRRNAQIEGGTAPDPEFHIEKPAANQSPDWDLIGEEQGRRVLEEVKGGNISKKERIALWRRIRRTMASLDAIQREPIVIRLSVDRANEPSLAAYWANLAVVSQQAPGTKQPGDNRKVTSAMALAEEALLHLTQHVPTRKKKSRSQGASASTPTEEAEDEELDEEDDAPGPVLTLERAREVLASFDYNNRQSREDVEGQIRLRIEALGLSLATAAIYEAARGFISARADDPEERLHTFRASELIQNIHALDRLSRVDPEDARLCRSICELALKPEAEVPAGGGLSYQDWRAVQPEVANALNRPERKRIALLGPGGTGKSTILRYLYEEARSQGARCLWLAGEGLAGVDPKRLGPALSLGAWLLQQRSGGTLEVFIDAFESAAPAPTVFREVLSSLAGSEVARVTLSVREAPWREATSSEQSPLNWLAIHLRPWDKELVRRLVHGSQRPAPTEDLLELLRTPLLLDIYLRTFHENEPLPPGEQQSRHGLIAAWWGRRILPDGDPKSIARAGVLERFSEEEVEGTSLHAGQEIALKELASEGLLVIERGGYRFRHTLLRDFTLQHWAARTGVATEALACLERIKSSLVRDGALRALLEATVDRGETSGAGLSLEALLAQITRTADANPLMGAAADVLGAFDDARGLAAALSHSLERSPRAASFMERLLQVASLAGNAGWVRELGTLPAQTAWAENSPLVGDRFLLRASQLSETAWRALAEERQRLEAGTFARLAERLRVWSEAPRVQALQDATPGTWLTLMKEVVQHAPSLETLNWLKRRAGVARSVRRRISTHLPSLVAAMQHRSLSIDEHSLQEIYLCAAGLVWHERALVPTEGAWELSLPWMEQALLGKGLTPEGTPGLLYARPDVFLPIALGMLVGMARAGAPHERAVESSRGPWRRSLSKSLSGLIGAACACISRLLERLKGRSASDEDEWTSLQQEMEKRLGPPLTRAKALGDLENDIDAPLGRRDPKRRALLNGLHVLFTAARDQGAESFERLWRAVRGSASAWGHLLLLQMLTEGAPPTYPEKVDELLAIQGLYHCREARTTLHEVLKQRWSVLSPEARRAVLQCIESTARSPIIRAAATGYLLDALPLEARPEALLPCWELFERHERSDPTQRALRLESEGSHALEVFEAPAPFRTTSNAVFELWRQARHSLTVLKGAPPARLDEVLHLWRSAWNAGFPDPQDLEIDPWPLHSSRHVLELLAAQRADSPDSSPALEPGEARQVAVWALKIMRARSSGSPDKQSDPFGVDDSWESTREEIWQPAAELLEQVLLILGPSGENALHEEFVTELRRKAGLASPEMYPKPRVPQDTARFLFHRLRLDAWPPGSSERRLLRELLNTVSDPRALRHSLQRIHVLRQEEQLTLFQKWLMDPDAVSLMEDAWMLVQDLGLVMGQWFLSEPNGPTSTAMFELLRSHPSTGLLASENMFHRWVGGITYAFVQQDSEPPLDVSRAEPSAQLLAAVWPVIRETPDARENSFDAVQWMFSPVFQHVSPFRPEERHQRWAWWQALEPLACQVVKDGSIRQVHSLVFELRSGEGTQALGARPWQRFVAALISRIDSELSYSSMRVPRNDEDWPDVLEYTCEFFEHLAGASGVTAALQEQLYSALSRWGETSSRAIQAAQRVRARAH